MKHGKQFVRSIFLP